MSRNDGEVTGGSPLRRHRQTEGEQHKQADGTTKEDCSAIIQYVGGVDTETAVYVHRSCKQERHSESVAGLRAGEEAN